MYHTSTQKDHWLFTDERQLNELRQSTNRAYCDKYAQKARERGCALLTAEEELQVVQYYTKELIGFCKLFNPPTWAPLPRTALATAVTYYKRFFMNCSVMEFHPKDMLYVRIELRMLTF